MDTPKKPPSPLFILIFLLIVCGLITLSFVWMNGKKDAVARTFRLPPGTSFEALDLIAVSPYLQNELKGARLISLHAPVVNRDGTVDLTKPSDPQPWVEYEFFSPSLSITPSAYNLPDEGNKGTKISVRAFEKGHVVSISRITASFSLKFRLANKGFIAHYYPESTLSNNTITPLPTCIIKTLWNQLPNQDTLLANERADIRFNVKGYEVRLPRLDTIYSFSPTCILDPSHSN